MKHFEQWQEERKLDTRNPPYVSDTKTPEQRVGAAPLDREANSERLVDRQCNGV